MVRPTPQHPSEFEHLPPNEGVVAMFKTKISAFAAVNEPCAKMERSGNVGYIVVHNASLQMTAVWTMGLRVVSNYEIMIITPYHDALLDMCKCIIDYFVEHAMAGKPEELDRRDWFGYYGQDRSECRLEEISVSDFAPFPDDCACLGGFTPLKINIRNTEKFVREHPEEHKLLEDELNATNPGWT